MALKRRAFTLIEILVALTITLIMMGAVASLFGVIANSVSDSRSIVEMSDRLRAVRNRLQADLQGATATMTPSLRPENDAGYLEIIEGAFNDSVNGFTGQGNTLFGDVDDAVLLTVRSRGEPFIGRDSTGALVESQVAEVCYFLRPAGILGSEPEQIIDPATTAPTLWWHGGVAPTTPTRLYTLFRHVRLVLPGAANPGGTGNIAAQGTRALTLGDLTKPENRFSHTGASFPFVFTMPAFVPNANPVDVGTDDIVMNNVLSFDVQAWDPGGPVFIDPGSGVAVEPRGPVFASLFGSRRPDAFGAYVDVGYRFTLFMPRANDQASLFAGDPAPKSGWTTGNPFFWDTWSMHYENDGEAQKGTMTNSMGNPIVDAATNGLDDDSVEGVDDEKERDALPPYTGSLRGMRIIVRAYEPGSQQVRQITVIQDFHTQ